MSLLSRLGLSHHDWVLWIAATFLSLCGLLTMYTFGNENTFFERQVIWIPITQLVFFVAATVDYRFLRKTAPIAILFALTVLTLILVLIFGETVKGARSRFDFGFFAFQPSDPAKVVLIALLAKYFARRHVEIAHIRHILVSGFYAGVLFLLVFAQPDFGSGIILGAIWFGMVLVSGISWKHLVAVFISAVIAVGGLWLFVFEPYQKDRIMTFVHPLADIQGAGYNAYQSTIAVGSGQLLGKGIAYGTQSKLQFLPEYHTDFIFAAFAEEWGFVGVLFVFALFGLIFWRLLASAMLGSSNFETLFAAGVAVYLLAHFIIHVGMNIGLLPVTGVTIPFMSYGGSHLIAEYLALGMVVGMRRYAREVHRLSEKKEFAGLGTVHL